MSEAAQEAGDDAVQQNSGVRDEGIIRPQKGGWLRPFQPGQSGNPSGQPLPALNAYHEARRVCAQASGKAIARQIELIDSDDERIALMASEAVLNRGIGKPRDHANESDQRADLSTLSPDERKMLARLLSIALGVAKPGAT